MFDIDKIYVYQTSDDTLYRLIEAYSPDCATIKLT